MNKKAVLFIRGRYRLISKIKKEIDHDVPIIWVHCASVGEFEQARPIMERYKKDGGKDKILLTFYSPSGYELRKNYRYADWVYYMPIDTPLNARRFVETVRPEIAIFIKYEFWYYHLMQLKANKIPTYLVSAIFRPSQPFFKWYGWFSRRMLNVYTTLFVQNDESKELLSSIGVNDVEISGDTRFDRVAEVVAENNKDNAILKAFIGDAKALVAGSTWEKDEEFIACAMEKFHEMKLVLVPHEVHPEHIAQIEQRFCNFKTIKYSAANGAGTALSEAQVLIVDCVGLLSSLYKYGRFAYVGGGFGVGIHNILEAAAYGCPVIFGPNYHKFKEACELKALGGAYSFSEQNRLNDKIGEWLEKDSCSYEKSAATAKKYVIDNLGATDKIIKKIRATYKKL